MALENLKKERLKKLKNIQNLGIDPYPASVKTSAGKPANRISTDSARKLIGKKVFVAGRLRSLRPHGKITFADLEDESGKIQLFLSQEELPDKYDFLSNLDLGDFIQAEGEVFKTQAGEITVKVGSYEILAKALLPLPSSWYGLKDVEERYRKRYLDLLMNPEVKKVFQLRSKIVYTIRKFMVEKKGYLEVETPILQPIYGGGRAKPFMTHHNALDTDLYLRISTELYLKRLIVGGFEKVFEIGRVFRNEGMDRNHNPEFTMFETMEAYADYLKNMDLIEEMFEYVTQEVFGKTKISYQGVTVDFKRPWKRIRLADLFKKYTGVDFHEIDTIEEAKKLAQKLGVEVEDFMTDSEMLLEVFEKKCTSELIQPTFVYDYPRDFFPLAKVKADNPKMVESFDIYVVGMEMGTNWSEQNNPDILTNAWNQEKQKAQAGNEEAQRRDEDFLEALEVGMPPTSGIGPGIDRWIMVLTGSPSISDVIPFPTLKPQNIKKKITQDFEKKFVVVLNNKMKSWELTNTVGHITAYLAHKMDAPFDTGKYFETKDGKLYPRNSQYPVVSLVANDKQLKELVGKLRNTNLLYIAYLPEMITLGDDKKLAEAIGSKNDEEIKYCGVGIFGDKEKVGNLITGLELWR